MSKTLTSVSMPFAKITPVEPVNDEFTLTKVYICSPGKNRNMSYISRQELDAAAPTLAYVPVVGHLMEICDDDGNVIGHQFGGHDYTVTDDLQIKALTVPFGVVTTDAPTYETVIEFGKEKEYEVGYAILWTGRYPELKDAIYSNDTWFGQSMELNYENYEILEDDSNYIELHGLSYSALCILGKSDDPSKHVEPCFPSARIDPVKFDLGNDDFSKAMDEMRMQLSLCFDMTASKKGGKFKLNQEKIDEIFANAEIAQDEIDFEITDDMTEEQLQAALEDFKKRKCGEVEEDACKPKKKCSDGDDDNDGAGDGSDDDNLEKDACKPKKKCSIESSNDNAETFSATANQKREALCNAMPNTVVRDASGNIQSEVSYWVCDFDDEYVYVERNYWTANDYECQYGRFAYAFDDSDKSASITSEFEEMIRMWLTKAEATKVESDRAELDTLRKFKAEIDENAFNQKVEEICNSFSDIAELEEFSSLKEKAKEFASLDDFETQMFALRGKQMKINKKPATASYSVKIGIDHSAGSDEVEPYGGLMSRYNIKPKK